MVMAEVGWREKEEEDDTAGRRNKQTLSYPPQRRRRRRLPRKQRRLPTVLEKGPPGRGRPRVVFLPPSPSGGVGRWHESSSISFLFLFHPYLLLLLPVRRGQSTGKDAEEGRKEGRGPLPAWHSNKGREGGEQKRCRDPSLPLLLPLSLPPHTHARRESKRGRRGMGKNSFFARGKRERKGAGKKTTTMRKRERRNRQVESEEKRKKTDLDAV